MIKTLDDDEKLLLLRSNYIGNLSYIYQNKPFSVPITYFYNDEQHNIICYSALGHKIKALRKNSVASLCVADIDSVNDWKSIVIHGMYTEHTGAKAMALLHQFSLGVKDLILRKELRDLDFINQFSSKVYKDDTPVVFTITIEEITGKMRKL